MNEIHWIKNKYSYPELKYSQIKSILWFGIIWNIFENEVCRNNARISDSNGLAVKLNRELDTNTKRQISLIWNHFLERYVEDSRETEIFRNFKFNHGDNKEFVKRILIKGKDATQQEKIEATIRIIFRLRNNLLHGEKDVSKLYDQNNNFKYANKFLMILIDKHIRIN